jgi:hypothetical protein
MLADSDVGFRMAQQSIDHRKHGRKNFNNEHATPKFMYGSNGKRVIEFNLLVLVSPHCSAEL